MSFLLPTPCNGRSYEIQFFTINLENKIDYPRLKKAGINTVILRVFQDLPENGGLYFHNSQFRVLKPVLEKISQEFDYNQMNLCAWMIGRKFNWISNDSLFDYEYKDGRRQRIKKLDFFNPDAVKMLINVYKELASQKINAILIQDDFIIRYNEGFSNWGRLAFSNDFGAPALEQMMITNSPDNTYFSSWRNIKQKKLLEVLNLIVKNCRMVNSAIKTGINVYYETPFKVEPALTWYGYTLKDIRDSNVDNIYLMSYQRQIKDELKLNGTALRTVFKQIVENALAICGDKLVVKVQLRDWITSERIPPQEVKEFLSLIPQGVKRICFTPVSPNDYEYLENILSGEIYENKPELPNEKKEITE